MKISYSKIFIGIIFGISIVLLLLDLPKQFYNSTTPTLPVINKSIQVKDLLSDWSMIDINAGPVSLQKELDYKLGLDLQGGVRIVYQLDMKGISDADHENAFESARTIIEKRINFFGVAEPTIQTSRVGKDYRIIVELPGVTDVNQAMDVIGRTAQLTFWEAGAREATESGKNVLDYPLGLVQVMNGKEPVKTKLTGKDLKSAQVVFDTQQSQPQVQLNFSSDGTKLFGEITKNNVGKPLAIVLDNELVSFPVVNQPITNGNAVISGSFTTDQAKGLSISLNAGALPVPLSVEAQSNIGPSLGINSLAKTLFGGFIGLLSVIVFMIFNYKKEGFLASIALIIYTIITLFIFKFFNITLTLAGIAGFILSIGMAVDANILIFERMKEERRAGKPQDIAVEVGFKRAWTSIRDSNISSLLTCIILFYFGSGMIRGFAVALAIGILVSMFSAITITRNLLRVFDKRVN